MIDQVTLSRNGGTILNVSSVAGKKAFPNHAAYTGRKFSVTGITENLREEVADSGVRVMAIYPGAVATELLSHTTNKNMVDGYEDWKTSMGGLARILREALHMQTNIEGLHLIDQQAWAQISKADGALQMFLRKNSDVGLQSERSCSRPLSYACAGPGCPASCQFVTRAAKVCYLKFLSEAVSPLWAGTGHPVGRGEACKVKNCVPHRRKSGLSPHYQISAMQLMSATVWLSKTSNNNRWF